MTPDIIVATLFLAMNGFAFVMFGFDKWRAGRSGRRVPERTLMLCGAPSVRHLDRPRSRRIHLNQEVSMCNKGLVFGKK